MLQIVSKRKFIRKEGRKGWCSPITSYITIISLS